MTVIVINPNSTAAMTGSILAMAETAAPGVAFEGWTSSLAPPAIQGPEDVAAATPPLLELVAQAARRGAGGVILACFDDPALAEARACAPCPVIGVGQAAFHHAALRGWRFSVVTTLPAAIPAIEANIRNYGLSQHLARVRASDVPVLALEDDTEAACARIAEEAERAVAEDDIEAVILGCAGMAKVTGYLRTRLPVPVIDGVEAAARFVSVL
ncbi:aspartate/glutamate racemase family protein [Rhodovulum sulfidophilum]|uniref:Aspartate/glutamate racemase family protein n=1 Tax=Rhodovulum sulfidophilum TaxID=35806 RepID=A0ABS1RPQ3_RHOSU|nr:aspartate/glutamate racemase family protein [Rhodovulum sulfidophilum]MBL3608051.1 aspartate/glutamate racemase family protein [Rhodovulum sulfidophilum]MCE8458738.1 aspartate/glutamate racemase family protein [Rhodovulum sulfidophilum]